MSSQLIYNKAITKTIKIFIRIKKLNKINKLIDNKNKCNKKSLKRHV